MNLNKRLMTKNDCYKAGRKITPKGIMIHSTAASGVMARQWFSRWNKSYKAGEINRQVCVHAFVDDKETWQYLDWNHRGWHAGGSANNTHIGIEICEPAGHSYKGSSMVGYNVAKNEKYFQEVWTRTIKLAAYLCKLYNLTEKDILDHSEGSRRGIASASADVGHWFPKHGKNMNMFRAEVGKLLRTPAPAPEGKLYKVQTGAYKNRSNADAMVKRLEKDGYDTYMIKVDGLYKVQTGAFKNRANADALADKLKKDGYDVYITTGTGKPVSAPATPAPLKVGDKVRVRRGAKTYTGGGLASFVYDNVYTITQITRDRVVINKGNTVIAAMKATDLIRQ